MNKSNVSTSKKIKKDRKVGNWETIRFSLFYLVGCFFWHSRSIPVLGIAPVTDGPKPQTPGDLWEKNLRIMTSLLQILRPLTAEPHPFKSGLGIDNWSVKGQWIVLAEVLIEFPTWQGLTIRGLWMSMVSCATSITPSDRKKSCYAEAASYSAKSG
jgi:hypothetical protein